MELVVEAGDLGEVEIKPGEARDGEDVIVKPPV